jgi:hypothetical protein
MNNDARVKIVLAAVLSTVGTAKATPTQTMHAEILGASPHSRALVVSDAARRAIEVKAQLPGRNLLAFVQNGKFGQANPIPTPQPPFAQWKAQCIFPTCIDEGVLKSIVWPY